MKRRRKEMNRRLPFALGSLPFQRFTEATRGKEERGKLEVQTENKMVAEKEEKREKKEVGEDMEGTRCAD